MDGLKGGKGAPRQRVQLRLGDPYSWLTHDKPWTLLVVSVLILGMSILLSWAWFMGGAIAMIGAPGRVPAGALRFEAVPRITQPEQAHLVRTIPAVFRDGFPARDLRAWEVIPVDNQMFGVKPGSRENLLAVRAQIGRAAESYGRGEPVDEALVSATHRALDRVEAIEGKNRAVVLYHRGLAYLLAGDAGNARKALQVARDETVADTTASLKRTGKPPQGKAGVTASRAAGVLAGIYYALGEAAAKERNWPEALRNYQQAQAAALGGRTWNETDTELFTLQPARMLLDYDSSVFLNDALNAAHRANQASDVASILGTLREEPAIAWRSAVPAVALARNRLATEAWITAAYWGQVDKVDEIAVDPTSEVGEGWLSAVEIARYLATDATAASMPHDSLLPWRDYIGVARNQLYADIDQAGFRTALSIPRTAPNRALLIGWRDATLQAIGRDLLDRGLAGDHAQARAFILRNRDLFPDPIVGEAAAEFSLFGAPHWMGWILSGALLLLVGLFVLRLWAVRWSCRLTFPTYSFDDRSKWDTPFVPRKTR